MKRYAFTMLELLFVIAIIGMLIHYCSLPSKRHGKEHAVPNVPPN